MNTSTPQGSALQNFPPTLSDFQAIFGSSLLSIKSSVYSTLFNDITPSSELCEVNGGGDFAGIASWYVDRWRSTYPSLSSKPYELTPMCRAYQKECLMNTNWTLVRKSISHGSLSFDMTQFCPQPLQKIQTTSHTHETSDPTPSAPLTFLATTDNRLKTTNSKLNNHDLSTMINSSWNSFTFWPNMSVIHHTQQPIDPKPSPQLDNSYKYLGLLCLLLPVIIIIVVVVILLQRKHKKARRKSIIAYANSTMSPAPSLQSFPATPTSTQNLIFTDKSEKKKQRTKKGNMRYVPRQLSSDSSNSTVYVINVEETQTEPMPGDSVDGDQEKLKMMENWKYQLETLAEMLTKSDTTINVAISNNTGQEDC